MRLTISVLSIFLFFCKCSSDRSGYIIDTSDTSAYMTDTRDNQNYKTYLIDGQWWMAENLKFLPYVVSPVSDSGIYVYGYYGNHVNEAQQTINYQTYGVLYDWATAMALPSQYNSELWNGSDSIHKGICPDGWHLPSNSEWGKLELFLKMSSNMADSNNIALKIKSDTLWHNNGNGTNETGFSAYLQDFDIEKDFSIK